MAQSMTCHGVPAPKELSIFTATTCQIMTLIASIFNTFILITVIKDPLKKLRNPFMFFVVNLAISDLITGYVLLPISVYVHTIEALDKLNEKAAKLLHMSFLITMTASILSLIALTLDRYVAIMFPLRHKVLLTVQKCKIVSFGIWMLSVTIPFLYFRYGFINLLFLELLVIIIIAFIIFSITYFRIYKYLQQRKISLKKNRIANTNEADLVRKSRKTTKALLILLASFLATYGTTAIMIIILKCCPHCNCHLRHWFRDMTVILTSLNSCLNPVIYTVQLRTFRRSMKALVTRTSRNTGLSESPVTSIRRTRFELSESPITSNQSRLKIPESQ